MTWLLPPCMLLTALACMGSWKSCFLSSLKAPWLQLSQHCARASGRPAEPSLCCRYHMLKSGENVVMMDEVRNADDVYGRLTDVVSMHTLLHCTLWLKPGARPMPTVTQMARARSQFTVITGHGAGALLCSKGGQTTAACLSKLD